MAEITEKIKRLKKEKNAVILAHCYQNPEIDEVADFVGDSLYLSRMAAQTDADIIVFAGVYFMAQTAKILSPDKKVLLPRKEAGCAMADMINLEQLRNFKAQYPGIPTVCYINSTAEVKSECDICCTSSNALQIVKSLNSDKVLFLPDHGCCPVHRNVLPDDILKVKNLNPDAKILTHPECRKEVAALSDYVGSTTGIMKYAKESSAEAFIIATEKGVLDRLKRDCPNKKFIPVKDDLLCESMKCTRLEDIYDALNNEQYEITVEKTLSAKALSCIDKMLEVSK